MSKLFVITGSPGGGTSYFTKFLRLNGYYAGKSLEDGKLEENHIGYLYRRKWHESIVFANKFCKGILEPLGVSQGNYEQLFSNKFTNLRATLAAKVPGALQYFKEDNQEKVNAMYKDEFPDTSIPHGWKNPRNFMVIPFIKEVFPDAKILTVERSINPAPSNQGPEGKGFAKNASNEAYREFVFGHDDDFRFQFEDFTNLDKVNDLLEFVGLDKLTQEELDEQHKKLDFNVKKIGK